MIVPTVIVLAYLLGSIPFGYLIVRCITGQDLTKIGSGRTGGTNAMRAAGFGAGVLTGILDVAKGALAVWLARYAISGQWLGVSGLPWVEVAAGLAAVLGHNHSIYLGFRGGAGTAPNVGAALAMCPFSAWIVVPLLPIVLFGTGYASVASLMAAAIMPGIFAVSARLAGTPWAYVGYGLGSLFEVTWALRPNIERLCAGRERMVGPRAKRCNRDTDQPITEQSPLTSVWIRGIGMFAVASLGALQARGGVRGDPSTAYRYPLHLDSLYDPSHRQSEAGLLFLRGTPPVEPPIRGEEMMAKPTGKISC